MSKHIIIVAPHADDEIIGCYEVIQKAFLTEVSVHLLFPNEKHVNEQKFYEEKSCLFPPQCSWVLGKEYCNYYLESYSVIDSKDNQLFFPDPVCEIHPEHRKYGHEGEKLLRQGANVYFYSVNMQAPYIREVKNPEGKKEMLNRIYPEKADLWKYDYKYFLFEGQCKWIREW